jgi:hypothetical protein
MHLRRPGRGMRSHYLMAYRLKFFFRFFLGVHSSWAHLANWMGDGGSITGGDRAAGAAKRDQEVSHQVRINKKVERHTTGPETTSSIACLKGRDRLGTLRICLRIISELLRMLEGYNECRPGFRPRAGSTRPCSVAALGRERRQPRKPSLTAPKRRPPTSRPS